MTEHKGRQVTAYYKNLIITGSKTQPGDRYYIYNQRYVVDDTFFCIEKVILKGWAVHHAEGDPYIYEESSFDYVDLLDWCVEYFKEEFVEHFIANYRLHRNSGVRNTVTTEQYWVGINRDRDGTWELRVDPLIETSPLFTRKGFPNPMAAKRAFASWLWDADKKEVTHPQMQRFVEYVTTCVSRDVNTTPSRQYILDAKSKMHIYLAGYEDPTKDFVGFGWTYSKWHIREFVVSPRLYRTKEDVFARIAKDIVWNGTEQNFGFTPFFEWLKEN